MFWKTVGSMLMVMIDALSTVGMPLIGWYFFSEMEDNTGWRAYGYGLGASLVFVIWLLGWIIDGYIKVGTWFF